ncbi:MAG: ATP-binding protein [Planctomycetota bacterium]
MSRILVINPDDDHRQLTLKLLNGSADWYAEPCSSIERATEDLANGEYHLVVIDLGLADANGHAFLMELLATDPLRPVLVTGTDSKVDQVVQALEAGAAGFVHTARLQADLISTLDRVMAAAHRSQIHARLLDCMTSSTSTFVIDNDPLLLPTLLTRFQASATLFGVCDPSDRTRIGIALEEALSNALYHGNLEVSSQLREESLEDYFELAGERRESVPYRDRRIYVTEILTDEYAQFVIRDEGPGFDTSKLLEEVDADNLDALSGRGYLLMKSFMDEVSYNEQGNEVTLIKRKKSKAGLTLAA